MIHSNQNPALDPNTRASPHHVHTPYFGSGWYDKTPGDSSVDSNSRGGFRMGLRLDVRLLSLKHQGQLHTVYRYHTGDTITPPPIPRVIR